MSTPSPQLGASLTSDGAWQPRRWETMFVTHTDEALQAVLNEATRVTNGYGQQGWEIVGSSVQRTQVVRHFKEYDKGGDHYFEWSIVCTLKRPLPPG